MVAESKEAVITALGRDRAFRVFAGLYMARQDVSVVVRQVWWLAWHVLVSLTSVTCPPPFDPSSPAQCDIYHPLLTPLPPFNVIRMSHS